MRFERSHPAGFSLVFLREIAAQIAKENAALPTSDFERFLAGWCLAYLAIPTQGVGALTPQNFGYLERNDNRKINVQVTYYKTRSRYFHKTAPVEARSPLGRALISHVENITQYEGKHALIFNIKGHTYGGLNSIAQKLGCVIASDVLNQRLRAKHKYEGAAYMFPPLFLASLNHLSEAHQFIFGLNTVKTSAVYSRTLGYDTRNIVNYNSHSNETERSSYLVELNEEWENLNGRVTRAVFQDLASNVFRESKMESDKFKFAYMGALSDVETKSDELTNSFKIITERNDGWVNELGVYEAKSPNTADENLPDTILILDSPETVVRMKHFLAELEKHWKKISEVSPAFFINTALPQAEFIETLFDSGVFSSESLSKGEALYCQFRHSLPPCLSSYY